MIDSIIPIGLILLYLLTMFLINYYRNISPRKKKAHQIKLEDIEPELALYCYNNGNASKLFWVTLLDLIDRGYYKLYSEENISYIKWNKKDILCFLAILRHSGCLLSYGVIERIIAST